MNPDVVIFAFIPHDLLRSMSVYSFIRFPEWESPYSKPRYVLEAGSLRLINTPLSEPAVLFGKDSVDQLPFLEYEPGYQRSDWEHRLYFNSYVVRLLASRFPQWKADRPETSVKAQNEINEGIFRSFIKTVERNGSLPLIVYLPAPADFGRSELSAERIRLRDAEIPFIDATPCLEELPPADRFVSIEGQRGHFTPEANQVLADLIYRELTASDSGESASSTCVP